MAITDTQVRPLCSLRLWSPGQADPIVQVREFANYTPLTEKHVLISPSLNAQGIPKLEWLKDIGYVCAAVPVFQNTRLSHYTTSGGSWEERQPGSGAERVYRLIQYDTSADLQWSATSTFPLPYRPNVWFSLIVPDTPPDHDGDTYPPYVRIELGVYQGQARWALLFSKKFGNKLLKWNTVAGVFRPVMDLGSLEVKGNADNNEAAVWLRCHRDAIGVSMDSNGTYEWYVEPNAGASIASSPFTVRGQGGMCVFGLHQLYMESGIYSSGPYPTGEARSLLTAATVGFRGVSNGAFGTVSVVDAGTPTSGIARWRATLTPVAIPGVPFTFYRSPELHAVQLRYPATTSVFGGTGFSSTPYEGQIEEVDFAKQSELDTTRGTVRIRLEAGEANEWPYGRFSKYELSTGHLNADGSEEMAVLAVGLVTDVRMETDEFNRVTMELELGNVSERFRRAYWSKLDAVPFGGMTLGDALDQILVSEGVPLNSSYRQWDPLAYTAGYTLDYGAPEEPFEWPRPGEDKWTTMQRLAGYWGNEIVPDDDGVLFNLPVEFYQPYVSRTLKANPTTVLQELVQALRWDWNMGESATAVLVDGKDALGNQIWAAAVDYVAERIPQSERFTPFRILAQETVDGTATQGMVNARASSLAAHLFGNKVEPDLILPVDPTVRRREQVQIEGFEQVNVTPSDRFVVIAVRFRYRPALGECQTAVSLLRLT